MWYAMNLALSLKALILGFGFRMSFKLIGMIGFILSLIIVTIITKLEETI